MFQFRPNAGYEKAPGELGFPVGCSHSELPAGLGPYPCPAVCVRHKGVAMEEEGAWGWGLHAAQALQNCSRPRGQRRAVPLLVDPHGVLLIQPAQLLGPRPGFTP